MVIFGAGASFDSSPTYLPGAVPPLASETDRHNDYNRPPLAKDLFANRPLFVEALDVFPKCKTIVPRLRAPDVISGHTSIEALLQEIEEEAKTYSRGPQELAAVCCYLQRAINECETHWRETTRGITNYLSLLREIERAHRGDEPVCLVTFNYDTLLEDALVRFGFQFTNIDSYTKGHTFYRVFKLHGSVNWGQEVDVQLPPSINPEYAPHVLRYMIDKCAELQISERFVLCSPGSVAVVNGHPVFPAIAIPVEKKQVFQCPQHMIDELTALLPRVTKILVIGWRATEAHFLDLLKRHLKRGVYLSVVAGNQAEAKDIAVRIHRALLNNPPNSSPEPTGFTEFIRTRRAEQILAG